MPYYIRFEAAKQGEILEEKSWVEALLSNRRLRLVTKERIAQLKELDKQCTAQLGDGEIENPEGKWEYCLFWIASLGTALLETSEDVKDPKHWLRPIIRDLATRLKALALDDEDFPFHD